MTEKHWGFTSRVCPNRGPNPQPKHVPCQGTELATFRFAEWCPTNWAMPARARKIFNVKGSIYIKNYGTQSLHKYVSNDIGLLGLIGSHLLVFVSSHPCFLGALRTYLWKCTCETAHPNFWFSKYGSLYLWEYNTSGRKHASTTPDCSFDKSSETYWRGRVCWACVILLYLLTEEMPMLFSNTMVNVCVT